MKRKREIYAGAAGVFLFAIVYFRWNYLSALFGKIEKNRPPSNSEYKGTKTGMDERDKLQGAFRRRRRRWEEGEGSFRGLIVLLIVPIFPSSFLLCK